MLESELAEEKAKGKVVGVFKIDLDKKKWDQPAREEARQKKGQDKTFERK
jgi:hypothetical protein